MNPVLILTHNCLELTKRCVESVRGQDVPIALRIIDNASTDGTVEWLDKEFEGLFMLRENNLGVSNGWNSGLDYVFSTRTKSRHHHQGDHCLIINNDTIIPPWFYRELLSYDEPFISGVSVNEMSQIESLPPRCPLRPHPDFSGFLIRREAWEKVGPFDERMKFYASDNDWHVRAHRAGVKLWQANVPFYHERSSTLKMADPAERAEIESQANQDREIFRGLYGCLPWEPAYEELFK